MANNSLIIKLLRELIACENPVSSTWHLYCKYKYQQQNRIFGVTTWSIRVTDLTGVLPVIHTDVTIWTDNSLQGKI